MTPIDVIMWVGKAIAFYWVFAWWGWWFVLAFIVLGSWWFSSMCVELGINLWAIPVVVVNDPEDK